MIEALSQLHPAGQVAAILGLSAFGCVAVWQFFKTMRD